MFTLNAIHIHAKDRKVFLVFNDEDGHVIHKPLTGDEADAFLLSNAKAVASLSRAAIGLVSPPSAPDAVVAAPEPEPVVKPEPVTEAPPEPSAGPADEPTPEPVPEPAVPPPPPPPARVRIRPVPPKE